MGGERTDEDAADDGEEPVDREAVSTEQSDPEPDEASDTTPDSVDDPEDASEETTDDDEIEEGKDERSPDLAPEPDLTETWAEEETGSQYDIDEAAAVPEATAEDAEDDEDGSDPEREDQKTASADEDREDGEVSEAADGEADGEAEAQSDDEDADNGEDEEDDEVGDDGDGDTESDEEEDDEETAEGDEDSAGESDAEDESAGPETVEFHDDSTPLERKTGPESDTEQPLADHIEEMIKRLAVVVVVAGLVSLAAFPFGEEFITFLWYSVLPADVSQPHVYHPLELVITQLKAASLLGLVLALPVFVYETYAFMRPGLYPHERRYYLAAVPTSLILASIGLLFGYFLVLPAVMTYFLYYSQDVVDIAFALGQTFNLMLILLGYLALVFQIPLFIMLAIMMGLTTRTWLEDRRLIFWGAFLGISFLFSPDPTGMAPILVAATMIALFEGTLLLLRWTKRGG